MDGILIVDKPKGWSSFDVVNFIKKRFGLKKVGHAGTLDPIATGVLVVLIGKATKLSDAFLNSDKEYIAELTLGKTTNTADSEGRVISEKELANFSIDKLGLIFEEIKQQKTQVPPMFSSVKYKGKRLYELARKGIEIERKPREIRIKKVSLIKAEAPKIKFFVHCSKGTYIRTICEDIGNRLGCGAYMSELRRVSSGDFSIDQAHTIEDLREGNGIDKWVKEFKEKA